MRYYYKKPGQKIQKIEDKNELRVIADSFDRKLTVDSATLLGSDLNFMEASNIKLIQNKEVLSSETDNAENYSGGYVSAGARRELIGKLIEFNPSDATEIMTGIYKFASREDYLTVITSVNNKTLLWIRSYDEAAIAYDMGHGFIFESQALHNIKSEKLAQKIGNRLGRIIDL